jgi:hypothetical protein
MKPTIIGWPEKEIKNIFKEATDKGLDTLK